MSIRSSAGQTFMEPTTHETRWRTYLRSATFIAPALLAWAFLAVFVFPKFQQMWVDSKMMDSEYQWMMSSLAFAMANMRMFCMVALVSFIALEFTGNWWPRYRRAVAGAMVFLLNLAIIVGLTGICVVGAIAGPALALR